MDEFIILGLGVLYYWYWGRKFIYKEEKRNYYVGNDIGI